MSATAEKIAEGLSVHAATEVPTVKLERFYEQMYPARAEFLKNNWRWLYRVGEFADVPAPLVAVIDGEAVGHAGLIPVTLRRDGEERTAIWYVDFGVLSTHQRKGIGIALTKEWMQACPLHITFCNERSIGVFLKYGWEERFQTYNFKLMLRPERNPNIPRGYKNALAHFAGSLTRVANQARTLTKSGITETPATMENLAAFIENQAQDKLHVVRSTEFYEWRIVNHPHAAQHKILCEDKQEGAKCAALVRVVNDDSYRRLHVLSLSGETFDRRALSSLFAALVRWALKEKIDHISYVTSDATQISVAKWWFPLFNRARFACHANDESGQDFLRGTNHFWENLDSDFDLMYH